MNPQFEQILKRYEELMASTNPDKSISLCFR